jgi:DNA-binding NarL/FixJ family response regulator
MRVLVDDAVSAEFPGLDHTVNVHRPAWVIDSFDARLGPKELVNTLSANCPDVLVVDSKWLVIGAPFLMSVLRQSGSDSPGTLITVPQLDNVTKVRAAHNGFTDVIRVDESNTDLLEKIEKIKNGESALDGDSLWHTVKKPTPVRVEGPIAESETDRAIIELIRIGIPDNEIAECLFLSPQTVRNRVSAMLQRDGFTNRTQLAWAYSNQEIVERFLQNPLWLN